MDDREYERYISFLSDCTEIGGISENNSEFTEGLWKRLEKAFGPDIDSITIKLLLEFYKKESRDYNAMYS